MTTETMPTIILLICAVLILEIFLYFAITRVIFEKINQAHNIATENLGILEKHIKEAKFDEKEFFVYDKPQLSTIEQLDKKEE